MGKMTRRDWLRLMDVLDHAAAIKTYLPPNRMEFLNNSLPRDAIYMRLQVVGDLIRNLSEEFREEYPELPWRQAVAMRNIIAHEYGKVKPEIIWKVLEKDFWEFIEEIRALTANEPRRGT